jgi:magnesium chelatase subunit I
VVEQLKVVSGLMDHLNMVGSAKTDPEPVIASAAEFILEGLYAQKKIGRSDDRGFVAPERRTVDAEMDLEKLERLRRLKKQVN